MRTKTIMLSLLLLIMAIGTASCEKNENMEIWECNPTKGVSITLSIDTVANKAYVSTKPKDLDKGYGFNGLWFAVLRNKQEYIVL
jgi:hypothetical protein